MPRKSPFQIELSVDEAAELNRRAAGNSSRGGQPVVPALLQTTLGRPRRESTPGTPSGLSPQSWRLRSRRSHASGQQAWACRCRESAWPTLRGARSARAWWPASVTARSGVGCTRTRFALGSTAAGSSRAILTSRPRPRESWTCTNGAGKVRRCATTAHRIVARRRCEDSRKPIPPWFQSTDRSMPVGSIRSRSTS